MASSPWVAVHLGLLPDTRVLSLQSKSLAPEGLGVWLGLPTSAFCHPFPALLLPLLAQ